MDRTTPKDRAALVLATVLLLVVLCSLCAPWIRRGHGQPLSPEVRQTWQLTAPELP